MNLPTVHVNVHCECHNELKQVLEQIRFVAFSHSERPWLAVYLGTACLFLNYECASKLIETVKAGMAELWPDRVNTKEEVKENGNTVESTTK